MKITPIGDRVVITPDPPQKETAVGFIIPDSSVEKPKSGKVLSVGEHPTITLKEGDQVLYGKISGTEVQIDGQPYIIMRQADVLCKIENNGK